MPTENYDVNLYATFKQQLDDTITGESGDSTVDLVLAYFNRAQDFLWQRRPWQELITRVQLTMTTSTTASLPAACGRLIRVWYDSDSDGRPDKYFFNNGKYDDGYYITNTFTKAGGHVRTISFYRGPDHTPYIEYLRLLERFTGTGSGDEYSYFPPNLLVKTAQKIHIEESDLVGNEYKAILDAWAEEIRDYEQSHQWLNIDMRMQNNDDAGDPIETEQYNLETATSERYNDGYDNSYDLG